VDLANDLRPGQGQQVVVALEVVRPGLEALAAVVGLAQAVALDHGAHGTVDHQDALGRDLVESGSQNGRVEGQRGVEHGQRFRGGRGLYPSMRIGGYEIALAFPALHRIASAPHPARRAAPPAAATVTSEGPRLETPTHAVRPGRWLPRSTC
jgi:hypothetical protein